MVHMTEKSQKLLSAALELSLDERAEIAAELIASIDGEPDPQAEAAWAAEIERRARRKDLLFDEGHTVYRIQHLRSTFDKVVALSVKG